MSPKLPVLLKNKYVIATIIFLIWITFFDRNDLITQAGYVRHLNELQTRKTYLQDQITETNEDLQELLSNPEKLKKFAREKYLMKKNNEDVYVIETPESTKEKK